MAKTLDGDAIFGRTSSQGRSLQMVGVVRLALGLTALLGAIIFLEGTSWDIQWHTFLGRDRTLIPPHIMMLSGVAISGVSGLLAVVLESVWARRNSQMAQNGTSFASIFSGSLGAYVVGFAALDAAVAFPLDAYWHALYGIDVAIWAPFHVMFVAGMGIVALGAAYMLASASNVTSSIRLRLAARSGVVIALATMLAIFTLLLFDSLSEQRSINLGFAFLDFFPLLAGLLTTFVLVAAAYALPWRWSATAVAGVYMLLAGIMALYVQPATDWLVGVERLTYRRAHPLTAVVAMEWFIAPLLAAILIDLVMRRARRKQWLSGKQALFLTLASLVSMLPIMALRPTFFVILLVALGVAGTIVSFVPGVLATYAGMRLGRNIGESISNLER
ncbi:hypothetical protein [Dictyobacter formicarum]|uniref:Cytochrome oxidase subunit I profile domain-containing protein n=1 Tax=Dictyobacter formicarum TaxID=2778368 RepID=A0ABQ3VJ23_9CHLR|nr:hypothetical protein [Dictyobacter formicarum]GHO85813.1 hypothetical protein KSZ_38190 [Dictyobacter formicarum]